jgi:hypothetical protein
MVCEQFRSMASAYIDHQLTQSEATSYRAHLSACADCCAHLEEIEQNRLALRRAVAPELPRELHSYIMSAVRQRAAGRIGSSQRLLEFLLALNPQLVSYTAGALVSAMLFALTLSGFKPIPVIEPVASEVNSVQVIADDVLDTDKGYHVYNNLPMDKDLLGGEHEYVLPRVNAGSSLAISFSQIAYQKPGNDGACALVEVTTSGDAKIVEVLERPRDPYLLDQLRWSLSRRPFKPASVSGQPVPTRIVLMVQKVDVSG